ncbi:MAG: M56 family metallopeptidase [Myxococcota bacterium]
MFSGTGWQHDVLGWMFTYLIHSTVLIVGVWVLTRVIPRMSLDTKETMWRVALFGGVLTSLVQAGFGLTPLPGNFDMPQAMVARADDSAAVPTVATPTGDEVVDTRIVEHQTGELTITTVREGKGAALVAGSGVPLKPSAWPWVILGLVTAGGLFALGRLALAGRQLNKQLQGRRDVIEDPVLETHLALCAKAELKKRPRLSASSKLRSPVALMNHEICLPERAVDSLSQPQQQGMLAHELAHLLRRDPLWRIGIAAFEAVFFFQPLNHFARRKLNEVAEFQCDDWAARNTGTGVHLAKCLAEVASWLDGGPPQTAIVTAMAGPSSPIVQRITRLLGNTKDRAAGNMVARVAFTVITLGAVAWFVPGVGYASPSPNSEASGALASADGEQGVRFVDASDANFDRSVVHVDAGDETVRVQVEARKPVPPPVIEEELMPRERRGDRLRIVIRGGLWGGGFPFCSGLCESGIFLDFLGGWDDDEWDDLEDLDDLIEGEIEASLHGVFGGARGFRHHRRHAERARRHAERARAHAQRARERAQRHRERASGGRDEDSASESGWFGLMGGSPEPPAESDGALLSL